MLTKIQSFYGFSKMPFGRDIAPGQLHRHASHAEAVARLTWAITTRSVAVLTGEVGAGKTASVRAALAGTDPVRYRPIYLPNPAGIGIRGICQQVVIACGQAPRFHTGSLLPQAAGALAAEAAERGRTPILILEEAHQPGTAQLETIRMLTSYDLDTSTCFAALLAGQPALRTRLTLGVLAALDQRTGLRAHLDSMTREETRQLHRPPPRPGRPRQRHPVLRRRDHPHPRHQPGPSPHHQQPLHRRAHRGLRGRARHRRPGRRPRRDHRGHRDTLSTTRDTPSTTQPRRNPSGGVFHSPRIPNISVTDILKINAAQQPVILRATAPVPNRVSGSVCHPVRWVSGQASRSLLLR